MLSELLHNDDLNLFLYLKFFFFFYVYIQVFVRRSVQEKSTDEITSQEKASRNGLPIIRRSKLLIVDLAGSERVDKSGAS